MTVDDAIKQLESVRGRAEDFVKKYLYVENRKDDFDYWCGVLDATEGCIQSLKNLK